MAIKSLIGMSERVSNGLPQIGVIHKGAPKPKGRPGADLEDHFRIETDPLEVKAIAALSVYGPKPNPLNVWMPYPTVEENLETWFEAYQASRLVGRSEGRDGKVIKLIDHAGNHGPAGDLLVYRGEVVKEFADYKVGDEMPHPNTAGKDARGNGIPWSAVGRLRVVIDEVGRAVVYLLQTTSFFDCARLTDNLTNYFANYTNGDLQGIPMQLKRSPVLVRWGDGANRKSKVNWLCSLELHPAWFAKKIDALRQAADPTSRLALMVGDGLPPGEAEAYSDGLETTDGITTMGGTQEIIDVDPSLMVDLTEEDEPDFPIGTYDEDGQYMAPEPDPEDVQALVEKVEKMQAEIDEGPPPPTKLENNDMPGKRGQPKTKRPLDAFLLQTRMNAKMNGQRVKFETTTERQINALTGAFAAVTGLDRKSDELANQIDMILFWLVGKHSIKELNNVEYDAIRNTWLEAEWKDGKWKFNKHAKAEAEGCYKGGITYNEISVD